MQSISEDRLSCRACPGGLLASGEAHAVPAARGGDQGDGTLAGLTVAAAARRMGVGSTTRYKLISSGEIPSAKVGRLRRVLVRAVNEFLQRRLSRDGFGAVS
ncbi:MULTISPECIES: helix-turn-helix domain-containing protein [unclassified Streptomyces]|uniref:helix-turn-helix domain-containing protein n=1 Tax=unclassified Streptomyces TaxID=2593676 RepID=UPI0036E10FED